MPAVLSRFQSGYLYHYAFVMLVGVAALVTYFMYPCYGEVGRCRAGRSFRSSPSCRWWARCSAWSSTARKEAVDRNCKSAALVTSVVTFLISLAAVGALRSSTKAGFQFEEKLDWVPALNIGYHMGIDGISLFFVLLSTLLTPICILSSWDAVHVRVKEYMVAFLVLETFMVGMFCALDLALFYVFFEGVLIPMFLIIGIWGGPRRVYAAFKFFLYTLLGSVLMLLAIIAIYWQVGTTDLPTAMEKLSCRSSGSAGCSWPSSPRSPSRCRCGRSIPGCPTPTSRRRPRGR